MTGLDRYYGYGPISTLCTRVITTLFEPAPSSSTFSTKTASVGAQHGYPSPPASGDSSPQIGGPSNRGQWQGGREGIDTPPRSPIVGADGKVVPDLMSFIAYALYRTRLSTSIVHSSLLFLTRLKKLYPSARGTSSSPHRLFLSALMLASKMAMDDTYSNRSWCVVGQQLFSLSEVNRMERELFGFLNWNCCISADELEEWRGAWLDGSEAESSSRRRSSVPAEERKRRRSSEAQDQTSESTRHRQATDAARALLKPASLTITSTQGEPASPAFSAVAPYSSDSSSCKLNDPKHMRQPSAVSMRSVSSSNSSDWTGSSQGSARMPASACGSSPDSRFSESPASFGPRTPESADAPYPVDDSTCLKSGIAERDYEVATVEAF